MKRGIWFIIAVIVPLVVFGQWSSNPMENLGIGAAAGDQAVPKMEATSDGGCYVSWFDSRSGAYCMYMQRLNSMGEAQWDDNGMLISSQPQMTWLVDYDLAVDSNDNAVVVFADIRSGGTNDLDIFAYKIAPDGSFLWGADGIGLSPAVNSDFEPAPKVAALTDGNFAFAWQKSGTTDNMCFQLVSADGVKLWGEDGLNFTPVTDHSYSAPDVVAGDAGSAIFLWKDSYGPIWAPTTELYTQKLDANGTPLWATPAVMVYNLGQMSAWTYPTILSDENGGAFFSWYDSPSLSDFTVRVGHVDNSGTLVFPLNGIEASTNSMDRLHMNPTITYVSSIDALYAFWVEENVNQSMYGVYGQRFSSAGDRLWGDGGMEYIGLQADQISFVNSGAADDGLYVSYFQDPTVNNAAVNAFHVDMNGMYIWSSTELSSATLGAKDDLLMVISSAGGALCSWDDGRNDIGDIYGQNVNADGSLGIGTTPQVTVTLTPYNPPIVIPATGGTFDFNIAVVNNEATTVNADVWTDVTLPNGGTYGPIINANFDLPGSFSGDRDRDQAVPENAPAGMYSYNAYVGVYPNSVWGQDSFDFEKLTTGDGIAVNGWTNSGESFDDWFTNVPEVLPSEFAIAAYPNPFNPTATLSFTLPTDQNVTLSVFDVSGRQVAQLVDGYRSAGSHEVTFDASNLASGIYIYQLVASNHTATGKMMLLK